MPSRSGVPVASGRKRLTGAHAARPPSKQGLKVAAAVVVPLLVAAALIAAVASFNDDDAEPPPSAADFQAEVDEAFTPLAEAIKVFLPKAQEFEGGKVTPADFKAAVDGAFPEFIKARDAVAALGKYKPKPVINRYFVDAADLYVEMARIYGAAVDPAAEPLRAQLNLAARRVRTLGDRIYDRGRVVLDPNFYAPPTQEVEIRPPTEVPDWVAEGMAAGPPLADTPGPAASTPPTREPTCGAGVTPPCRAEQPKKEWESRLKATGFPQPPDVARALKAADATRLGELAAAYEAETRTLMAGPDPQGDRERAAAVGLGLLTDGEAARLGQAAALLPPGDARDRLVAVARRLLAVGDELLEPGLGFRRSGVPRSVLKDKRF